MYNNFLPINNYLFLSFFSASKEKQRHNFFLINKTTRNIVNWRLIEDQRASETRQYLWKDVRQKSTEIVKLPYRPIQGQTSIIRIASHPACSLYSFFSPFSLDSGVLPCRALFFARYSFKTRF